MRNDLPPGLLAAIGNVESGGWGWSVNGNNGLSGQRFANAEDALAYTESLFGSGFRTIDIGCFQVDLRYHPEAFPRWQDGFNEDTNAAAAAAILTRLHAQTGTWSRAIALYHSADPQRGQSYLQAVMTAWVGRVEDLNAASPPNAYEIASRTISVPVAVWGPGAMLRAANTHSMQRQRLPTIITP